MTTGSLVVVQRHWESGRTKAKGDRIRSDCTEAEGMASMQNADAILRIYQKPKEDHKNSLWSVFMNACSIPNGFSGDTVKSTATLER